MNLGLVTLGCTKNQVDSELLLGVFKKMGIDIVNNPELCDIIVINTCGFIESAKKEAIDTILEYIEYKKNRCKHLIVVGCLAKRYKEEIYNNFKEVDLVIGNDEYDNIDNILSKYFNKVSYKFDYLNKLVISKFPLAYVKISEGCNNNCAYCAIPLIRGKFKSRKLEDIIEEVKLLVKNGITDICLISQDTTCYGLDIYGEYKLSDLLIELNKLVGIKVIRILYMYLYEIDDKLINTIKDNEKIAKYFDIPIQHTNNKILKLMNRHDTKELIFDKINYIRNKIPDAIIRTTVIVGFPYETDKIFNELLEDIKVLKFDRLGAFSFSREINTVAYDMKSQVSSFKKQERLDALMKLQSNISYELNKKYIGKTFEVLIEDINDEYYICRSYMNAPDVDGVILVKLNNIDKYIIGKYYNVRIIDFNEYDLFAELI
ncbi:MAG: 30S ribosomal protein S12 methylthiotransferase RimO [Clostridia bacterium]